MPGERRKGKRDAYQLYRLPGLRKGRGSHLHHPAKRGKKRKDLLLLATVRGERKRVKSSNFIPSNSPKKKKKTTINPTDQIQMKAKGSHERKKGGGVDEII